MDTAHDSQLHPSQTNTTFLLREWLQAAYSFAARLDRVGVGLTRLGLVVVLCWVGGAKFAAYEAESIVPFVANSPLMSFFYAHPAPEYQHYANKEGDLVPAHRQWHETNRTYLFSYGLGSVIILIGLLMALHPVLPHAAALGSLLLIVMSLTTLSFLVTTPEAWVPALGTAAHGFPFLAGPGRLVVKDAIMLGAAVVTLADQDTARSATKRNSPNTAGCWLPSATRLPHSRNRVDPSRKAWPPNQRLTTTPSGVIT